MNDGLIPRRYAKALLKFACEKGQDKALYALMKTLSTSFAEQPDLCRVINNPFVPAESKIQLLTTASGAKADGTCFDDFLKLLVRNNRIGMAREIALAYLSIYRKANNIFKVDITTASQFPADEMMRLKELIERHVDGATVEYHETVDPELIGGFTVNIDSERLDASVKNELKQLRLKLLSR